MFNRFKYLRVLIVVFGSLYSCQPIYAQRAGTTSERNEDAYQINELYKQGKWEEGKKLATEFLNKNPKDADMRMLVGKYHLNKQQYEQARYELVKSLMYAPANVDAKHMLVAVETETHRYSSAICYINELLEVNPYWKGLWRKKIELYRIMGNHVEADRLLKRISQIYPEDRELKNDQAYMLDKRLVEVKKSGRIDETIEMSRKMIDEQPRQADTYFSLVNHYIKAGDYNNALIYAERALNQFPRNSDFVQKKIAILHHQQRYPEILAFLNMEMKNGTENLLSQYNYFLMEAARNAKNNDPLTLYGKIFEGSPGNKEAFDYVFNEQLAKEQYGEAIDALNKHRRSSGDRKDLDMKELEVYKKMDAHAKVATLTRAYIVKYPGDADLKESYVAIMLQQAKANMLDGKPRLAVSNWKEVIQHGDEAAVIVAQQGLFSAYFMENRYQDAIVVLDDMFLNNPGDADLIMKKADLYNKLGRLDYALDLYEQILQAAHAQDRERLIIGYGEMIFPWIKKLKESYRLTEARNLSQRWVSMDEKNTEALLNLINLSYQLKDYEAMLRYAQRGVELHGEEVTFKIKLAEAMNHSGNNSGDSWTLLHRQVKQNPFHEPLLNTFVSTTEDYAGRLLKAKDHNRALLTIDTALYYRGNNRSLKYMKGLAYEGLKQYDSAYNYQKFYEPALVEVKDFKNHLNYLGQKSLRNYVGISHLRARFGDDYVISSISTVEYTRLVHTGPSYTGRVNYAGRDEGKGIQGQFEWYNPWTSKLATRIDIALSNKFFAKMMLNAAALYEWKPSWEAEAGIGYRRFFSGQNLLNLNLGMTKEIDDFRLGVKLSNFLLDSEGERFYLYSLGAKAQYVMGNPRNYIMALGSIGNSPDIDLLNNQLYNSFNVFNAMVGAGLGRSITKNVGASVIGTWYNFQTDKSSIATTYRNLYNLYFQLHVSF
ncbi:tetratricopeptide repeat protein [Sphingobacterium anhuiense]|uniref:Tetratricopeptide repeat protein n=1 Tax=Sphingobacterium anhuiense TaxID=493780 RepID=A0ABW5Z082_9SPHI